MTTRKPRPRYRNLRALISALAEGAMSKDEIDQALDAVQMGIGLSKRDKALGVALEQTGEEKDGPSYWNGYRDGLIAGYEGARTDIEAGVALRPIAELAAEAQAEAGAVDYCLDCGSPTPCNVDHSGGVTN